MRILITGANGYLGGCLLRHLNQRFPNRVVGACRKSTDTYAGYGNLSGRTDWSGLLNGVDVVLHTAAIVHRSGFTEEDYFSVNSAGAERLARAASASGVKLFVQMSTVAVYGSFEGSPFSELDLVNPRTPYARSKLQAEYRIQNLDTRMSRVILRCPMIYGEGAPGNSRRLFGLVNNRIPIPIKGVRNKRSFLSSFSVLSAVDHIIESKLSDVTDTFNLTEPPLSTVDLVNSIAKFKGKRACLFSLPDPLLGVVHSIGPLEKIYSQLAGDHIVNGEKFRQRFGWSPLENPLANLRASAEERK